MKKKIFKLLILFIFYAINAGAQIQPHYIIFYKPYTDSIENNLYLKKTSKFNFKIQYDNVKNADVNKDLAVAIGHNDYRFISISGYSYLYPGLDGYAKEKDGTKSYGLLKRYDKYLKKYKSKVIDGTSDAIDASNPPLQDVAHNYAEKYNKLLLMKIHELEFKKR